MIGDRELMRFHDGELSASEAALVEKELERDAGARAKLRGLSQTGELVRQWATERSEGFDAADQIMARLEPPARKRSRIIERWLPAGAAVALAAAVLLMVFGRGASVDRPAPAALSPHAPKTAAVLPAGEPSVSIESVDFGEKPGTIFMVGGESGTTPVIWLSDPAPSRMPL